MLVVVFEIIVDSVLEHLKGFGKRRIANLSACDVKVTAALKSLKDKLNVDAALASTRNYYVVVHTNQSEGSLHALDVKQLVRHLEATILSSGVEGRSSAIQVMATESR